MTEPLLHLKSGGYAMLWKPLNAGQPQAIDQNRQISIATEKSICP